MNEEKTIVTTRRFEQWWRKVQAWFIMTFATKQDLERINIDTTDLAKEVTSQEINNKLNDVTKESTSQDILREVGNVVVMIPDIQEGTDTIKTKIDELSITFDDIYAQQLESIIG